MSPLRIESSYSSSDDIKITEIKESATGFSVGPADAARILCLSRTTLFRYDAPDVSRINRQGVGVEGVREYNDHALLKIASETGRVEIKPDQDTGLTKLVSKEAVTLLNIKWDEAALLLDRNEFIEPLSPIVEECVAIYYSSPEDMPQGYKDFLVEMYGDDYKAAVAEATEQLINTEFTGRHSVNDLTHIDLVNFMIDKFRDPSVQEAAQMIYINHPALSDWTDTEKRYLLDAALEKQIANQTERLSNYQRDVIYLHHKPIAIITKIVNDICIFRELQKRLRKRL